MEQVIKKFVDWCFADGTVKWIAWRILRNMENGTKDENSLQIMALRVIVEKKMKENVQGNLLFSLVFREEISLKYFVDRYPHFDFHQELQQAFSDRRTGYRRKRKIYLELRKDPYIMFAVCEQLMDRKKMNQLELIMTKTDLIIRYASTILAIIPNRDNREYDTYWATKFFQLCIQKRCVRIWLQAEEVGEYQWQQMRDLVHSVINSVFPKQIPERGWINEFARGDRTVYKKSGDFIMNSTRFTNQFYIVEEPYPEAPYWRSVDKI